MCATAAAQILCATINCCNDRGVHSEQRHKKEVVLCYYSSTVCHSPTNCSTSKLATIQYVVGYLGAENKLNPK